MLSSAKMWVKVQIILRFLDRSDYAPNKTLVSTHEL